MKLKKNLKMSTSDFWYDLFEGGYIDPSKMCVDTKDKTDVKYAIQILEDFKQSCEDQIEDFIQ
jgi:hypothetical protein